MKAKNESENYSDAEAARRRDATIRNMIATPPQKHEPIKRKTRKPKSHKQVNAKNRG